MTMPYSAKITRSPFALNHWFRILLCARDGISVGAATMSKSFLDGMACVVVWVSLVHRAIVRNASNDHFGVIAASESAIRISPIFFGLAAVSCRHPSGLAFAIRETARRFRRSLLEGQISHVGNRN